MALVASGCAGAGTRPGASSLSNEPSLDESVDVPVIQTEIIAHDEAHVVPEPGLPLGPLPSFNESPGCGGPDGIRGPYADGEGTVPDTQTVGGPWGDFFGREMAEIRDGLVAVELPNGDGQLPVIVYVHERVAPALEMVVENLLREQQAGRSYRLDPGSVFSFRPATVPPKRYLSFHAVGAAVDINADLNPYRDDNVLITDMPRWFVRAWTEAGWCWGGDWQEIKDPMHFSWMGPLHSPAGYPVPERIPPRTAVAGFTRSLTFTTGLGPSPEGAVRFATDMDRDGAPDAVQVGSWSATDRLLVESAEAIHSFDTCRTAGPTPDPQTPGSTLLFADRTGDGRPDLWEFVANENGVSITVFTFASAYAEHLPVIKAPGVAESAVLRLGDHDRDGSVDLFVIEPGDPTRIEVRLGPSFRISAVSVHAPVATGSDWRFALGRRDDDWIPDVFALGPADPATLVTLLGADALNRSAETLTTGVSGHDGPLQIGDLDGDGRDDLIFFDTDGTITTYLGGDRGASSDTEITSWFVEGDDQPWEYREGCPTEPMLPR
jgi:hypothetical protein